MGTMAPRWHGGRFGLYRRATLEERLTTTLHSRHEPLASLAVHPRFHFGFLQRRAQRWSSTSSPSHASRPSLIAKSAMTKPATGSSYAAPVRAKHPSPSSVEMLSRTQMFVSAASARIGTPDNAAPSLKSPAFRECDQSTEVGVTHQPKVCHPSAEDETSPISRRNTCDFVRHQGLEPRTR